MTMQVKKIIMRLIKAKIYQRDIKGSWFGKISSWIHSKKQVCTGKLENLK